MFPVDHPSTVHSVAFGLWCSKHEGTLKSSTATFLKNKNATAMIMQEPLLWTVWELLSTNCSSPCSRTKLSITRSVGYHEQLCWRFFQRDTLALLQSNNSHIKKTHKIPDILNWRSPLSILGDKEISYSDVLTAIRMKDNGNWKTLLAMILDISMVPTECNTCLNTGLAFYFDSVYNLMRNTSWQLAFHLPDGWVNFSWICSDEKTKTVG